MHTYIKQRPTQYYESVKSGRFLWHLLSTIRPLNFCICNNAGTSGSVEEAFLKNIDFQKLLFLEIKFYHFSGISSSGCIKGELANQVHSQTMIALDDCSKKAKRKRKGDQREEVDFQKNYLQKNSVLFHFHEWQLCDLHKDEPRPIIYKPECLTA